MKRKNGGKTCTVWGSRVLCLAAPDFPELCIGHLSVFTLKAWFWLTDLNAPLQNKMITHCFEPMVGLHQDGIAKEQTHSPYGLKQEKKKGGVLQSCQGASPHPNHPKTSHQAPPCKHSANSCYHHPGSKLLTYETGKTLLPKLQQGVSEGLWDWRKPACKESQPSEDRSSGSISHTRNGKHSLPLPPTCLWVFILWESKMK